jgi:hypothetical protein
MTTPAITPDQTDASAVGGAAIPPKGTRRMLGVSLQGWENAAVLFLIVAGIAAALAAVATWSVVRMQRAELADATMAFGRYKLAAEAQLAEAKKEAVETAQNAGNALVRAAALEKETAELKSANLNLEMRLAPRRLSGAQSARMSAILTAEPRMKLAVVSRAFDSEGKDFADDLALTLNNAQWEAVRHDNWTRGDSGIFIATVDGTPVPPEASALRAALDAAGIAYRTMIIRNEDTTRMSPWFHPNVLYLIVGAKP